MNIKHSLLIIAAAIFALNSPVMADDNSDGKKPIISDIQTTFQGDNIQLTINGVNFLGKKNANPLLSIGNGLFKAPDFTATFSNTQIVVTAPKAKLPNADYLVWVSKDDKFSRENSDYFDLTVGAGGPQGPTGINGKDGAPGKDGAAGQQGLQGVPGAQGIIGSQGSKGDQGSPGAKGDTGAQGAIGPQGPKGDQGSPGAAGISGYEVKSVSATIGSVFNNGQALTAVCPSNKKVLGGGCDTQTPLTQAINSLPTPDNRGWGCRFNTGGINERITAYAVCANVQ